MVSAAHDISSGGLIVALSEMSLGSNIGIKIEKPKKLNNLINYFFGEDQGRYLLEIEQEKLKIVEKTLQSSDVFYEKIGETQINFFEIEGEMKTDINDLFKINNQWYNNY